MIEHIPELIEAGIEKTFFVLISYNSKISIFLNICIAFIYLCILIWLSKEETCCILLGIVGDKNEEGLYNIEQRNKFSVGEEIEVMKPDGTNLLDATGNSYYIKIRQYELFIHTDAHKS